MKEFADFYSFVTFQDGDVILHKSNYRKHKIYHPEISGPQGLSDMQDTLICPDFITSHFQKNTQGRIISRNKSYYRVLKNFQERRKRFVDYWVVRLKQISQNPDRWCITTAFMNTAPLYAMINTRVQTVIYKKP